MTIIVMEYKKKNMVVIIKKLLYMLTSLNGSVYFKYCISMNAANPNGKKHIMNIDIVNENRYFDRMVSLFEGQRLRQQESIRKEKQYKNHR